MSAGESKKLSKQQTHAQTQTRTAGTLFDFGVTDLKEVVDPLQQISFADEESSRHNTWGNTRKNKTKQNNHKQAARKKHQKKNIGRAVSVVVATNQQAKRAQAASHHKEEYCTPTHT